jgi:hypothetical protein
MWRIGRIHDAGQRINGGFRVAARQRSDFSRSFSHLSDFGSQHPFLPPFGLGMGFWGFGLGFEAMGVLQ